MGASQPLLTTRRAAASEIAGAATRVGDRRVGGLWTDALNMIARSLLLHALSSSPSCTMQIIGGPPMFVLMWFSPAAFVYETSFGGAEKGARGP